MLCVGGIGQLSEFGFKLWPKGFESLGNRLAHGFRVVVEKFEQVGEVLRVGHSGFSVFHPLSGGRGVIRIVF